MKNVTFKQAVRWAGNPNRLAIKLGVTRQAIHEWKQVIPELRKNGWEKGCAVQIAENHHLGLWIRPRAFITKIEKAASGK